MSFKPTPEELNQIGQSILTSLYTSMNKPVVPTLKSQINEYHIPPFNPKKPRIEMSNDFLTVTNVIPKSQPYLNYQTPPVGTHRLASF